MKFNFKQSFGEGTFETLSTFFDQAISKIGNTALSILFFLRYNHVSKSYAEL
jgi:hypothetical protein